MTFDVRRASLADAVALPAIERSAAQLFRLDPPLAWLADAEVPDAARHRQAIEQAYVWVAENSEGQLTGFVRAVDIDQHLHIEELSVSQAFQGQGMGRALVAAVIEQARDAVELSDADHVSRLAMECTVLSTDGICRADACAS